LLGPARVFTPGDEPERITRTLEHALEHELDALREAIVVARDFTPFVTPIEGRTSTSLIYDRVRALRAWLTGRPDPSWRGHFTCQTRPHHVFLTAPRKTTPDQH
jgi:hypothetical protein